MTITLDIPPETEKELRELSESEKLSVEEIVADMVRRRLAAKRFREACRVVEPFAKAAGFTSEEQILESFS